MDKKKENYGRTEAIESTILNRRTYLGAVAGSVFANATTATAQEADLSDVTWLRDGEQYTYENATFEIRDTFVQDSVFYHSMPDAAQVRNGDGLQYLFVNPQFERADTVRPPFSKLAFIADDKRYESGDHVDQIPLFAITDANRKKMGQTYHTELMTPPESAVRLPPRYKNPTFTIGFALPQNLSAERFGLGVVSDRQIDAAWRFDGTVEDQLRTAPQFETPTVDSPKSIGRGEPFDISISVENTGQRSGTYRAIVGHRESEHKKRLTVSVPAEEEVTRTMKFEYSPSVARNAQEGPAVYQVRKDDTLIAEQKISVEAN